MLTAGAVMVASDLGSWPSETRYLVAAGVLVVMVPALLAWVHGSELAIGRDREFAVALRPGVGRRRWLAAIQPRPIAVVAAGALVGAAAVVAAPPRSGWVIVVGLGVVGAAVGSLMMGLYRRPKASRPSEVRVRLAGIEAAYRTVIRERPDVAPRALLRLAELLERGDDIAGARAAYEKAMALDDAEGMPRAAMAFGVLMAKQGDLAAARAAFELAIESGQPEVAGLAALSLGALLTERKDLAGARAAYQLAIERGDLDAELVAQAALELIPEPAPSTAATSGAKKRVT